MISAFRASVSSAETEAATGTTVNRHKHCHRLCLTAIYKHLFCWLHSSLDGVVWPVSWATELAARASVASVTMSSVVTVTMLISLSEVHGPAPPSPNSSELPSDTTSRFMPALPWCTVLTWERRLSTRLNPRPHLSHRNGFSPETTKQR